MRLSLFSISILALVVGGSACVAESVKPQFVCQAQGTKSAKAFAWHAQPKVHFAEFENYRMVVKEPSLTEAEIKVTYAHGEIKDGKWFSTQDPEQLVIEFSKQDETFEMFIGEMLVRCERILYQEAKHSQGVRGGKRQRNSDPLPI